MPNNRRNNRVNNRRNTLSNKPSSNKRNNSSNVRSSEAARLPSKRWVTFVFIMCNSRLIEIQQEQLPRNDSSPPDRKRQRRSPNGAEQQPPAHSNMTSLAPFSHQPQQGAPGPSQLQNGVLRGLPGFPGQQGMSGMGNNPNINVPMGGAPMMNQGMMNSNGMLNPQMASVSKALLRLVCE